jgi:hypothetical protein
MRKIRLNQKSCRGRQDARPTKDLMYCGTGILPVAKNHRKGLQLPPNPVVIAQVLVVNIPT